MSHERKILEELEQALTEADRHNSEQEAEIAALKKEVEDLKIQHQLCFEDRNCAWEEIAKLQSQLSQAEARCQSTERDAREKVIEECAKAVERYGASVKWAKTETVATLTVKDIIATLAALKEPAPQYTFKAETFGGPTARRVGIDP